MLQKIPASTFVSKGDWKSPFFSFHCSSNAPYWHAWSSVVGRIQSCQSLSEVSYLVAYGEFITETMVGFHTERNQCSWTKESTISGHPTCSVGSAQWKTQLRKVVTAIDQTLGHWRHCIEKQLPFTIQLCSGINCNSVKSQSQSIWAVPHSACPASPPGDADTSAGLGPYF